MYTIDLRFLDPRRPHRAKLTAEEQEERLIPYQDSLPIMAPLYASYNKQVRGRGGRAAEPGGATGGLQAKGVKGAG